MPDPGKHIYLELLHPVKDNWLISFREYGGTKITIILSTQDMRKLALDAAEKALKIPGKHRPVIKLLRKIYKL